MRLSVDSSVLVAVFLKHQDGHAASLALFGEIVAWRHSVSNPFTVLVEVAGAVRRRAGEEEAKEAVAILRGVSTIKWEKGVTSNAPEVAIRTGLRGMDAIVAAHAVAAGTSLVTLDDEILERAKGHVDVLTPDRVPS